MSGINIANGVAANSEQTVDSNGNAHVVLPTTIAQSGYASVVAEVDGGAVLVTKTHKALEATEDYRLRVGLDSIAFSLAFEGSTIAQDRIQQTLVSMTAVQANGFLSLNAGNSVTINQSAYVRSYRSFQLFGSFTTYFEAWLVEANQTATGAVSEWGAFYASGVTAPTDGVFFRRMSGGALQAVCNFNGNESMAATIDTTNVPARDGTGTFDPTECQHYVIAVHNDNCQFWINDTLVANLAALSVRPGPSSASSLPWAARVYNTAGASAGRRVEIGFAAASFGESAYGKRWDDVVCGAGGGAYQIQPGSTSGGTVSRAAATSGYPANTTAKTTNTWTALTGPANSELGGRWLSPAISTLATESDYPLFSYLNPAGTVTLPGKNLYVKSIRVGETIAIAAASTNGIMLIFSVGVGSTAASTATADGAATVGPRIGVLGSCYFLSTAAIGQTASGWTVDFPSPLIVPPGTYLHIICRPVGTVASNTLVVTGSMLVNGYFE
jgi:hypothetical protein